MSIYKRGKSWYYDFLYRGERYAGCIGVVSKTVAKEVLAKKKAEVTEGRYTSPAKKPSPFFEEVMEEYLRYYRTNQQPRSVARHEMSLRALKQVFEGKRLQELTPKLLEEYKEGRRKAGRSEVTINRELACLKHLFTMAIAWGLASSNPVKEVKLYREHNGKIRFLTEEEETLLLAHCSATLKPIVITALHTGFRKSEVLSLTWQHVDFQHRLITVEAAYAKNRETRSVPMTAVLTETLKAIRINTDSQAPVFLNSKGKPYRDISTALRTAVRHAGLKNVSLHTARHTFASRLIKRGVDLKTVQELMGHKHITMTLRYAHLAPGHKRVAIAVLDQGTNEVPSIFTTGDVSETSSSHKPLKK